MKTKISVPHKPSCLSATIRRISSPVVKAYAYLGGGCLVISIFATLIAINGLDTLVLHILKENRIIKSGTALWERWRTMPIDIYVRLYLFNITNPQEFAAGAKAELTEIGPYVFLVDLEKADLFENESDHTIRYRTMKWMTFQSSLSGGSIEDEVTFVNAVFVITATMVRENVDSNFIRREFDKMLSKKGERLTRTERVRDLLFDGINIRTYTQLLENPIVTSTLIDMGFDSLPSSIANDSFALFQGANATDRGWLVVHSGVDNTDVAGVVVSYNGRKKLTTWRSGGSCNDIRGTDGSFLPPYVSKSEDWWIFTPQVCRSIALSYHSDAEYQGVSTWRFSISKMFQAPKTNPDNWCFCPVTKNGSGTCQDDGITNLAPCFSGAPISLSQPHFYGAERWIQEAVDGLQPGFENHTSQLHVHPFTGIPLSASGRFQLCVEVVPYPEMPSFATLRRAYVPIAWLEMVAEAEAWQATCFRVLDWLRQSFTIICAVFIAGGIALLIVGINKLKGRNKVTIIVTQPQNDNIICCGQSRLTAISSTPIPSSQGPDAPDFPSKVN